MSQSALDVGIKKLEKRKRRLQRSIVRRYENNKKGECYRKTSNLVKREKEFLKAFYKFSVTDELS